VTPDLAFAVASAVHVGFQLTVTAVVYPALATRRADEWPRAHDRHRRTIAPVVLLVYGALLATGGWLIASGPGGLELVAVGVTALAFSTTAFGAAPIHGRLTQRDTTLVRRLFVVDRVRCAFAVAAGVLAVLAIS